MSVSRNGIVYAFALVAAVGVGTRAASAALVGEWLFDNQTLVETSGYQTAGTHDGVAIGTVGYIAAPSGSGYAINLTGGSNAVKVLNSNAQINGSLGGGVNATYKDSFDNHLYTAGAMTFTFWAMGWPDNQWEPFISKKGEVAHGYQVRRNSTNVGTENSATFTLRSSSGADDPVGTVNTNDGQWHYYTATYGGGFRTLYVDGFVAIQIADTGLSNVPTFEFLMFGARDNGGIGSYANVIMDDVRIYDTALTRDQARELMAPGRKSLQFDVGTTQGSYDNATQSPAHNDNVLGPADNRWNTVTTDKSSGLIYTDGSAAAGVQVDFGRQANDAGAINWGLNPVDANFNLTGSNTGSGVTDTALMEDWLYTQSDDNLAVRVKGLDAGIYDVYALVREPNQLSRTYQVAIGTDSDNTTTFDVDASLIDAGLFQHSIGVAGANNVWAQGLNYVLQRLYVTGPDQWVVIIVDPTNAAFGTLQGFQIIAVPAPAALPAGLVLVGLIVSRRGRR